MRHIWKDEPGCGWKCLKCKTLKRIAGADEEYRMGDSIRYEYQPRGKRGWVSAAPSCVTADDPAVKRKAAVVGMRNRLAHAQLDNHAALVELVHKLRELSIYL